MRIWEFDVALYGLLRRCLRNDYVSDARDLLSPQMRLGLLRSVKTACVDKRCACGDSFCRSFSTLVKRPPEDKLLVVRFRTSDELNVTCDAAGELYEIEYLRFDFDEGNGVLVESLPTLPDGDGEGGQES